MEEGKDQDIFKETVLSAELIREFDALDRGAAQKSFPADQGQNENLEFSEGDLDLTLESDSLEDSQRASSGPSESIGAFVSRIGHRFASQPASVDLTDDLKVNQFLQGMFSKSVSERSSKSSSISPMSSEVSRVDDELDSESIGAYLLKVLEPAV